jgi:hypothetical protein
MDIARTIALATVSVRSKRCDGDGCRSQPRWPDGRTSASYAWIVRRRSSSTPRRRPIRQTPHAALLGRTPLLAKDLQKISGFRAMMLKAYAPGVRLEGLDDLLAYLDLAHAAYDSDTALALSSRLIRRARADFVMALDAALAGLVAVAADCMRDVLEIEMLLLDFATDPSANRRWLDATDSERRRRWAPGAVRKRLREASVDVFTTSAEGEDYKAHSLALHVNPHEPLIGRRGQVTSPWEVDAAFWDIFEHGARLVTAIEVLRAVRWRDGLHVPELHDLKRFNRARDRVHETQETYFAVIEGTSKLTEELGRPPTAEERWSVVNDKLTRATTTEPSSTNESADPRRRVASSEDAGPG